MRARTRLQPFYSRLHRRAIAGLGYSNTDAERNGEHALLRGLAAGWRSPVLVDAGAFLGSWTLAALEASPAAKVYALEPNPDTFAELERTLAGRARAHMVALGAEAGKAQLFAPPGVPSQGSLHRRDHSRHPGIGAPESVATVPVVTLDAFCAEQRIDRLDFVKLDLEGGEIAALEGARGLLGAASIDAIQFEFGGTNIDSRTYMRDFFDRLSATHRIHRILSDGLAEVHYDEEVEIFAYANYVALRTG